MLKPRFYFIASHIKGCLMNSQGESDRLEVVDTDNIYIVKSYDSKLI